jgi:hypothetical protein
MGTVAADVSESLSHSIYGTINRVQYEANLPTELPGSPESTGGGGTYRRKRNLPTGLPGSAEPTGRGGTSRRYFRVGGTYRRRRRRRNLPAELPGRRNLSAGAEPPAEAEPPGGTAWVAEDAAQGPSCRQYVSAQDPLSRRDVLARDLKYWRNDPAAA